MEKFSTGAVRSSRMVRYDLIPKTAIERLAKRCTGEIVSTENDLNGATGGALKYGECNWEKGLPTSDVINHVYDHLSTYANQFRECLKGYNGDMNTVRSNLNSFSAMDDDLAGAMWGLMVLMYQEEHGMFHDDNYQAPTKPVINEVAKYNEPREMTANEVLKMLDELKNQELTLKNTIKEQAGQIIHLQEKLANAKRNSRSRQKSRR